MIVELYRTMAGVLQPDDITEVEAGLIRLFNVDRIAITPGEMLYILLENLENKHRSFHVPLSDFIQAYD